MALIEIKDCTECSHFRVSHTDTCGLDKRDREIVNTKHFGVPDWCPLNPDTRPEPPDHVFIVTATVQVPIVAKSAEEAEAKFDEDEDVMGDPVVGVIGPIGTESELTDQCDWDLDKPAWRGDKAIGEYLDED